VDLSGECGAPVLLAVVDRCQGLAKPWRLPLTKGVARAADGQFVSGDPAGANLAGCFVVPAGAKLAAGQIPGSDDVFLVMTLQRGAAPAVRVVGSSLDAKVSIGPRTIAFDGQHIVFGK
jgi:hypothetical protein